MANNVHEGRVLATYSRHRSKFIQNKSRHQEEQGLLRGHLCRASSKRPCIDYSSPGRCLQ